MSILTGFNVKRKSYGIFDNVGIKTVVNTGIKTYEMWENQKDIFRHRGEKLVKIIQPCGAGKSVSIQYIATHNLLMDPNLRVVIAVPQNIIKKTFKKCKLAFPNEPIYKQEDKVYDWDINNNLCDDKQESKIQLIADFLNKEHYGNDRAERIAIISHSALARLYSTGLIKSCDNTMFFIDEAHHIMYSEYGVSETSNMLGQFVQWIVEEDNTTCKLWLTTATFFRSDKYSIIPPEVMNKFVEYVLPYDEYWEKYIKYIKSFSYDFVIYKDRDVFTEIKEIVRLYGRQKTIVFCPYIGDLVSVVGKLGFLKLIKEAFLEVWPECRILDLVTEEDRKSRKEDFIEGNTEYDIALAVRLFDEGSDWVHASCAMDLAPSNSLRIQQQRFGRIGRDHESKSHIQYHSFLPYKSSFKDTDERRKHLSNSWNALIASSLLNEMIEPIPYPGFNKKDGDEKGVVDNNVKLVNPIRTIFPDDVRKQEIIEDVVRNLVILKNSNENPSLEETQKCIMFTLKNNGIEEKDLEITSVYIAKLLRKTFQNINIKPDWENQTVDVSWMSEDGFDKIWPNDMYDRILSFTSGVCDVNTFKEFRDVYNTSHISIFERVSEAKQLAFENNGILPNVHKLQEMKRFSLVFMMSKYPEFFKDIIQEKIKTSVKIKVEQAEFLARNNGGILQSPTTLIDMGHQIIVDAMKRRPQFFKHIIQEKQDRNLTNMHVIDAEILAKNNGGKLPNRLDLIKMGKRNVYEALKRDPESFKHIPKCTNDKKSPRTSEYYENSIKQLHKLYGGIPYGAYLEKNGYSTTLKYIYRNPEILTKYNTRFLTKKETINATSPNS